MNKWKNLVEQRRKGIIKVSREFMNSDPDLVQKVLSKCLVVEARQSAVYDETVYYLYNECFEEVPNGTNVPVYDVVFEQVFYGNENTTMFIFKKSEAPVIFL